MMTGTPWSDDVYDLVLLFCLSSVLSVVGLYEQPYVSLIALGISSCNTTSLPICRALRYTMYVTYTNRGLYDTSRV